MDCPSLLGRTLSGLTITVQSLSGVNCFCLSVWLPAFFDSPAAFYLFVSARICSLSPPPPPQTPNPSALLEKKPFTSCRLPHLICRTRNWSPFGLNRRYSLSSLFGMRRVWLSSGVQCLFVLFFVFITVPLAVWKQESAVELLKTDIFSYRAHNLLCALYIFWTYLKPLLAIHVVQFLLHKENNPSCYLPDQTELGYDCSFSS